MIFEGNHKIKYEKLNKWLNIRIIIAKVIKVDKNCFTQIDSTKSSPRNHDALPWT